MDSLFSIGIIIRNETNHFVFNVLHNGSYLVYYLSYCSFGDGMKVVCISDTHMEHHKIKLPYGDILIHAGDALSWGTEKEFVSFASWFRELPHVYKIYVAGNHDKFVEFYRNEAQEMLGPDVHYLQDSLVNIEDYEIYGSPWQPVFNNWAFNLTENELRPAFDLIPPNLDILITHSPPRFDNNVSFDRVPKGEHIGSTSLTGRLYELGIEAPLFHVFGHVHDGYGVGRYAVPHSSIVAVNAATCNEQYEPLNPPVVLNI